MPGRHHQLTAAAALLGVLLCGLPEALGEDAGRQYRDGFAGGETELTWRP
jgi:hypothetical protein